MTFASRLSEIRRKLDLTQDQLAFLLGYDRNTIGRWEAGLYAPKVVQQEAILLKLEAEANKKDK